MKAKQQRRLKKATQQRNIFMKDLKPLLYVYNIGYCNNNTQLRIMQHFMYTTACTLGDFIELMQLSAKFKTN